MSIAAARPHFAGRMRARARDGSRTTRRRAGVHPSPVVRDASQRGDASRPCTAAPAARVSDDSGVMTSVVATLAGRGPRRGRGRRGHERCDDLSSRTGERDAAGLRARATRALIPLVFAVIFVRRDACGISVLRGGAAGACCPRRCVAIVDRNRVCRTARGARKCMQVSAWARRRSLQIRGLRPESPPRGSLNGVVESARSSARGDFAKSSRAAKFCAKR